MSHSSIVGRLSDFADGKPHRVTVDDLDVCVVQVDGELHAIDDICTHAEVSLSEGDVINCTIECWMHGAIFDLKTGAPLGPPATTPVQVHTVTLAEGDDPEVQITLNETRR
ncbi:MAG: non-heme iron oxygenase ferredoxin subunit [Actinobacteria bacterium]|nr:non-heme iron oxygenase ferredoxin subunit [Actinomycetota bacterium]NBY15489.1 non-heme iron oxygenase ferredoxin subunit [Actinomycetota bacterium]